MGSRPIGSGRRRVYSLPGVWDYFVTRAKEKCDAPDPRLLMRNPGAERDRLIEEERLQCLFRPGYRKGKYSTADIDRLEAGLPVLVPAWKFGGNTYPQAKAWAEIRERSVQWFEVHPDDRVIPVTGAADPSTYWD